MQAWKTNLSGGQVIGALAALCLSLTAPPAWARLGENCTIYTYGDDPQEMVAPKSDLEMANHPQYETWPKFAKCTDPMPDEVCAWDGDVDSTGRRTFECVSRPPLADTVYENYPIGNGWYVYTVGPIASGQQPLCNSGNRPRYAVRLPTDNQDMNKWSIWLEGGSACGDDKDCAETRWHGTPWAYPPGAYSLGKSGGFFASQEKWAQKTIQVHVGYCSSDYFSGNDWTRSSGTGFYKHGAFILQSVIQDLVQGIDVGREEDIRWQDGHLMLFSGSSAGATSAGLMYLSVGRWLTDPDRYGLFPGYSGFPEFPNSTINLFQDSSGFAPTVLPVDYYPTPEPKPYGAPSPTLAGGSMVGDPDCLAHPNHDVNGTQRGFCYDSAHLLLGKGGSTCTTPHQGPHGFNGRMFVYHNLNDYPATHYGVCVDGDYATAVTNTPFEECSLPWRDVLGLSCWAHEPAGSLGYSRRPTDWSEDDRTALVSECQSSYSGGDYLDNGDDCPIEGDVCLNGHCASESEIPPDLRCVYDRQCLGAGARCEPMESDDRKFDGAKICQIAASCPPNYSPSRSTERTLRGHPYCEWSGSTQGEPMCEYDSPFRDGVCVALTGDEHALCVPLTASNPRKNKCVVSMTSCPTGGDYVFDPRFETCVEHLGCQRKEDCPDDSEICLTDSQLPVTQMDFNVRVDDLRTRSLDTNDPLSFFLLESKEGHTIMSIWGFNKSWRMHAIDDSDVVSYPATRLRLTDVLWNWHHATDPSDPDWQVRFVEEL